MHIIAKMEIAAQREIRIHTLFTGFSPFELGPLLGVLHQVPQLPELLPYLVRQRPILLLPRPLALVEQVQGLFGEPLLPRSLRQAHHPRHLVEQGQRRVQHGLACPGVDPRVAGPGVVEQHAHGVGGVQVVVHGRPSVPRGRKFAPAPPVFPPPRGGGFASPACPGRS